VAPNPFAVTTALAYAVEAKAGPGSRSDLRRGGPEGTALVSGFRPPGRYTATWDGRGEDGRLQPGGLYFARRVVGATTVTSRVLFMP